MAASHTYNIRPKKMNNATFYAVKMYSCVALLCMKSISTP